MPLPALHPAPLTPAQAKARYQAYQQRARERVAMINRVHDAQVVEVGASPTVWEVPEGAFVEAVIWVPGEQIA